MRRILNILLFPARFVLKMTGLFLRLLGTVVKAFVKTILGFFIIDAVFSFFRKKEV